MAAEAVLGSSFLDITVEIVTAAAQQRHLKPLDGCCAAVRRHARRPPGARSRRLWRICCGVAAWHIMTPAL
jgi:hypothetical protein